MSETTNCPACGSSAVEEWSSRKWKIIGLETEFSYLICNNCEMIYCEPVPTEQELFLYYSNHFSYDWYEKRLLLKKLQAKHRWIRIRKFIRSSVTANGKLLDIGCGHGLFVQACCNGGIKAVGVDFPSRATKYAIGNLGQEIVESDFEAAVQTGVFKDQKFEFITAWHCLEHYSNPLKFLELANTILEPGGKILLAVPNSDSYGMRMLRDSWCWCQEAYLHVIHYNKKNLSMLLNRSGLALEKSWSRDTWDANPTYDIGVASSVYRSTATTFAKHPRMALIFQEAMRLLFYFLFRTRHWLFSKESADMSGSELLILARKPPNIKTPDTREQT